MSPPEMWIELRANEDQSVPMPRCLCVCRKGCEVLRGAVKVKVDSSSPTDWLASEMRIINLLPRVDTRIGAGNFRVGVLEMFPN